MMWTYDRPDGGRGFGFTGGHKHVNWYNDSFRKVVLNAILWLAKVEIPSNGVESRVSIDQIAKNLDPKRDSDKVSQVAGKWDVEVQVGDNTGNPKIELVQAGINLLGRYDGLLGQREITGQVRDKNVSFQLTGDYEGSSLTVRYQGSLKDDGTLAGGLEFESDQGVMDATWTARRAE
jgi:hypothetical protein